MGAADQCLGDSGYIDYWTITITYDLPPNPPSNLYGNPGPKSGEVTLSWDPSSGPDLAGYWLRLGTSSGHYFNSYKITLDEIASDWTGLTFYGLTNGTRYYFAVAAYDSRGWGSCLSNEISIVPGGAAAPPTGVIAVPGPGSGQLILKWDGNTDAYIDHYKIYQGTSSGIYDIVYNNIPKEWLDGTTIFDLIDNKTYYFVMTSVNVVGVESVFSNVANAIPTYSGDAEPPSNPANLYITDPGTGRNLQLSWYPSSDDMGVSHYLVYRLTNSSNVSEYNYDSGFPQYAFGTSFADNGLSDSNTYYYRVMAVDTSENRSGLSNLAWKKPDDNTTPSAPPYVGIYAGISVLDLWWTVPDTNTDGSSLLDLAGYNIYRGISDGIYNPAPINGASPYTGVSYTDSGAISGQIYYYAIKAVDNDGHESPFSMQVSAQLASETQPPVSPISLSITEKETELLLTWNSNHESDLVGYNIYRHTSSGVYARINFSLLTNTWHVDANVSPGQTYYYVVTAVDENGNESGYSNEVSGMIGQGEIWINYPTTSNTAGIDFGDALQSNHAVISYSYDTVLSSVYLEIMDSNTGEIVYDIWDWKPPPPSQPDYLTWDGKYTNSNECVPDGWYGIRLSGIFEAFIIETEERWSVYVIGCDGLKIINVTTPCEGLAAPHTCADSFIANSSRTGEIVIVNGKANFNASDISNQITWKCSDNPKDGIDSRNCNPSSGTGISFSFNPDPPSAENGRSWPLSYQVKAKIIVNGTTYEIIKTISQDILDQLRQEYHDMNKNQRPERNIFVNALNYQNPGNFTFEEINSQSDITTWALFRIAQNLENVRNDIGRQAMPVNSGYRTPKHNASPQVSGAVNSEHIYGLAADISSNRDYNGDGIVGNRADWDFLKNAAKNRGACVEPYDSIPRVHMDWRGTCPNGY